jgi:hypothetical protein
MQINSLKVARLLMNLETWMDSAASIEASKVHFEGSTVHMTMEKEGIGDSGRDAWLFLGDGSDRGS